MASSSSQSAQATVSDEHQRETKRMREAPKVTNASEASMEERPWTQMEDIQLLKHVVVHGGRKWRKLSRQLHDRSPDTCKVRWFNKWNPHLEKRFGRDAEQYLVKREDDHAREHTKLDSSAGTDVQSSDSTIGPLERPSVDESDLSLSCKTDNSLEIDPIGKSMSNGPSRHGHEQNILMANRPKRKRAMGTGGLMAEKGDTDMASKHDANPSSLVFPSMNLMSYPISFAPNNNQQPQSPPSTPKFIDFLGVGSV